MRRLLSLILLLVVLPASAGLLDALPNAKLGAPLNNSSDFLPVREAFRLSLVNSDARAIRETLIGKFGFAADHVVPLENAEATRAGASQRSIHRSGDIRATSRASSTRSRTEPTIFRKPWCA